MTKNKTNFSKIIIIIIISLLAIIVSCFIGAKFLISKNGEGEPPASPPPETIIPTLSVESELSLYIADQNVKFLYTTENLSTYTVSCYIEDSSIAEFDSYLVIIPKSVGTTKIITSINTSPQITKETTLKILPVVTDVEFKIVDSLQNKVSKFYTDTEYTLIITDNIITNLTPEIFYSENIGNFNFVKKEDLNYYFTFKVLEFGEFEFIYENKYYEESSNYYSHKMPTDFNVEFTNLKLYLFDLNYLLLANENNFYNKGEFIITTQENTNDSISLISYDKNIVEITGNIITAKSEGSAKIKFKSNVSGIEKEYEIMVEDIKLDKVKINDSNNGIDSVINLEVNKNETIDFVFNKQPLYCNNNLSIRYNNEEVSYTDSKLSLINDVTSSVIYIKDKLGTNVITINFKVIETYRIEVSLSNQNYLDVILENSVINVAFEKDEYISLEVYLINELTNIKESEQNPKIDIDYIDICEVTDKIINGIVNIKIKAIGVTTIKITYDELNVELILTIIIF